MTVLAVIGIVVVFGGFCAWVLGRAAAYGDHQRARALATYPVRETTWPSESHVSGTAVDRVARFLQWGLLGAHHEPGTASDEATAQAVAVLRIASGSVDAR